MVDPVVVRASQLCRILGNPTAYGIVRLLHGHRRRPMELAADLGVSSAAVVNQLRNLKLAGLVRFHSSGVRRAGRKVEYWLARPALGKALRALERALA